MPGVADPPYYTKQREFAKLHFEFVWKDDKHLVSDPFDNILFERLCNINFHILCAMIRLFIYAQPLLVSSSIWSHHGSSSYAVLFLDSGLLVSLFSACCQHIRWGDRCFLLRNFHPLSCPIDLLCSDSGFGAFYLEILRLLSCLIDPLYFDGGFGAFYLEILHLLSRLIDLLYFDGGFGAFYLEILHLLSCLIDLLYSDAGFGAIWFGILCCLVLVQ